MNNANLKEDSLTYLGTGIIFEGLIKSQGTIRVEGRIKGDIPYVKTLVVSEKGRVDSNIKGSVIVLDGEVHGDVKADEMIKLMSKGKIVGNIQSPLIEIESGACLMGRCHVNGKTEDKEKMSKEMNRRFKVLLDDISSEWSASAAPMNN